MRVWAVTAATLGVTAASISVGGSAAAAPPPCGGSFHITDAVSDGHHAGTDVTAAWFSEAAGLQAVIRLQRGEFAPAHDDSEAAGFAMIFTVDGVRRYVRAEAPRSGAMRFDAGVWSAAGGFASQSVTSGGVEPGTPGTVTIDVPGVAPGTRIGEPFVLTYDGEDAPGVPHWVDRAPGGTSPAGREYGAELVIGACAAAPPALGAPGALGASPASGAGATPPVAAVSLTGPARLTGGGTATVSGAVRPAIAGLAVAVRTDAARTTRHTAVTGADGTFALRLPIGETTRLRATAGGLGSPTVTVTVASTVRIAVRRRGAGVVVTGRVRPALPGRVLWLRDGAAAASARTTARAGRFRLRLTRPEPGRYQAVFLPSGARAERSTSNAGVID